MTVRIGIAGIRGRMGREIATLAANDDWLILVGGLSRHARAAGSVSDTSRLFADAAELLSQIDVLIDFSAPGGDEHARQRVRDGWRADSLRHDRSRRRPDGSPASGGRARRGLPCGQHESGGECRPRRPAHARARPPGLRHRDRRGAPPAQSGRAVRDCPGAGTCCGRSQWRGCRAPRRGTGARERADGKQTRSVFTPSGREATPVSTPWSWPARAKSSAFLIAPSAGRRMRKAPCAQLA